MKKKPSKHLINQIGNFFGTIISYLIHYNLLFKLYNYIYEHSPHTIVRIFVRYITLPNKQNKWNILLLNKKITKCKILKNNLKTAQFSLSYQWHSPSLNFIEKLLIQHSPSTSSWIDVGANLGLRSLLALSEGRKVYMIEPNQELNALNIERCEMNQFSNYEIIAIGASDAKGTAEFYIDESSYNSSLNTDILKNNILNRKETISLDSLDSLFSNLAYPPFGIKIDVEGHEIQVLKGAEQLIKKWHPPLIVEVNLSSNNFSAFSELMDVHGYSLFQIKSYRGNKYFKAMQFKDALKPETNDFLAIKNKELEKIILGYCI